MNILSPELTSSLLILDYIGVLVLLRMAQFVYVWMNSMLALTVISAGCHVPGLLKPFIRLMNVSARSNKPSKVFLIPAANSNTGIP